MQKISDYNILEKISETRASIVFRAKKEEDKDTVVIKLLKTESPAQWEIARYKQEFELIVNLDVA